MKTFQSNQKQTKYKILSRQLTLVPFLTLVLLFELVATTAAADSFDLTYEIVNILDAGSQGGSFGLRLKKVNGPLLADYNSSGPFGIFYPASTIKVLQHLHAMRKVQQFGLNYLATPITQYQNSCSNTGATNTATLAVALQQMMLNSNNSWTNAIQDFFGREAINDTAHVVVGMSFDTELNHKFGCGGPTNSPANSMTLSDITHLYERYANGNVLGATYKGIFEIQMLNEDNNNFLQTVIDAEASSLGLTNGQKSAFNDQFNLAYKAGSIPDDYDGLVYQSTAGYVTLPKKTCGGVVKRSYAFGVFIDGAASINGGVVTSAIREMLRSEIKSTLQSFKTVSPGSCASTSNTVQLSGNSSQN